MKSQAKVCLVAAVLASLLAAGCGSGKLRGAKTDIPKYPKSKVIENESMSFAAGDLGGKLDDYDGTWWILETKDDMDKVVAFYKAQLPQAKMIDGRQGGKKPAKKGPAAKSGKPRPRDDDDDGEDTVAADSVLFTYTPAGWNKDEEITIEISPGKIHIHQTVLSGKH